VTLAAAEEPPAKADLANLSETRRAIFIGR
jgi:hypothetical protein